MKKHIALLGLLLLAAGCTDRSPTAVNDANDARPSFDYWGVDSDNDGLDDGTEWGLANQYAPLLYMPNLISRADAGAGVSGDWTWPANVEWYTANTQLRFHHDNCPDHQILNLGYVNTSNLVTQSHQRATSWLGCSHSGTTYSSSGGGGWSTENHFFLQAVYDDVTHPGVRDPSQWKTYVHVYPNIYGGVNIQYWFFYAYNDFVAGFNHEGDWEHVTVALSPSHQPEGAYFGQHNGEKWLPWYQITTYNTTHPQVWVGDGSHASYPSEGECDATVNEGWNQSCWSNVYQRWFTWSGGQGGDVGLQGGGLVNMGEVPTGNYPNRRPMSGMNWIRFSGRWGENGVTTHTNGPQSPTWQAFWKTEQAQ